MRQRLGIAAALLGDPPILMLDEPVDGLGPEGIRWFRGFARELAAQGRAVFVSSHPMGELEDTADHLVVIGRGRLVADVGVAELLAAAAGNRVVLRTPQRSAVMTLLAGAGATVTASGQDALTVEGLPGHLQKLALDHGPTTAGLAVQLTKPTGIIAGTVPVAPWTGFAVLCAYAAVALLAACWLVARRDA